MAQCRKEVDPVLPFPASSVTDLVIFKANSKDAGPYCL